MLEKIRERLPKFLHFGLPLRFQAFGDGMRRSKLKERIRGRDLKVGGAVSPDDELVLVNSLARRRIYSEWRLFVSYFDEKRARAYTRARFDITLAV